jgi:hypothetical protein
VKVDAVVLVCNPSPPSLDVLTWHRWFRDISDIDNVASSGLWPNLNPIRRKFRSAWKIPDDARTGKRKKCEGQKTHKMN